MPVSMAEMVADLRAESGDLDGLLAPVRPADWELPTPAEGWAIRDQVSHLAWFDDAAVRAVPCRTATRCAAARCPRIRYGSS